MHDFFASLMPNVMNSLPELTKCFWQTIEMITKAGVISAVFGIIFGVVLVVTSEGNILPCKSVNIVLDKIINIFRAIPSIILIALLMPLSRLIVGTAIGTKGAIVPLAIGTIPFFARQIQAALYETDSGIIEAAKAMGSHPLEIICRIYLRESLGGMIRGATITMVNLIGFSAIAGSIGAGGLGDYAIRYGHQRSQTDAMWVTVIILLALVTLIQSVGNFLARKRY